MCGIICEICNTTCGLVINDLKLINRIKNRGPDSYQKCELKANGKIMTFLGSVLWMQGSRPVIQPVENDKGILLYNGDIFDEEWSYEKSDTEEIMARFTEAVVGSTENIINKLKCFKGPFSIIYYNKQTCDLLFTRDKIGRNSLLLYKSNNSVVISSVLGREYECIEIPPTHIYILNVVSNKLKLYSWETEITLECELFIDDWVKSIKSQQSLSDEQYSIDDTLPWILDDKDNIQKFIELTSLKFTNKIKFFQNLLNNIIIENIVQEIIQHLDSSVRIRLKKQLNICQNCLRTSSTCNHSSIGILFSGGLDCTILAFLADKYVMSGQSIDLLNVAFNKNNESSYEVPDRLTGRQSLKELRKVCPQRKWIFKEVNVPRNVLIKQQEEVIGDLVHPRETILDESLGSALWFAAQGIDEFAQSPCRVLLLGSGADELFGGYTRHRNAYKRYGWNGLNKELLLDWKRISLRNLARDNRVICDHGRQPRMPYLDENFANFVFKLNPWFKCFPSEHLGPGVGEKLFLRLVAFRLGLESAAVLPKRALQFGTRIANRKQKGNEKSSTFIKI